MVDDIDMLRVERGKLEEKIGPYEIEAVLQKTANSQVYVIYYEGEKAVFIRKVDLQRSCYFAINKASQYTFSTKGRKKIERLCTLYF